MVEERITPTQNVVDLASWRDRGGIARAAAITARAAAITARVCRHCGAVLAEGEREEECSATFVALGVDNQRLRWQAAQILRGLISVEA